MTLTVTFASTPKAYAKLLQNEGGYLSSQQLAFAKLRDSSEHPPLRSADVLSANLYGYITSSNCISFQKDKEFSCEVYEQWSYQKKPMAEVLLPSLPVSYEREGRRTRTCLG